MIPIFALFAYILFSSFSLGLENDLSVLLSLPILPPTLSASEISTRYSCQSESIPNTKPHKKFDFHLRGTALGGWLVLEPWITPSLFYQFLGASEKWGNDARDRVALDSITFCSVLGPEEANRQLRNHWKTWVTEDQIRNMAEHGVETLRIPVADWMFDVYTPFNNGCWDGSLEELDRVLALIAKYKMTALIDIHTARGSQNGLDNSGDTSHYEWVGTLADSGSAKYNHWTIRGGDWIGKFNHTSKTYMSINSTNFIHSLKVVSAVVDRYADHPEVIGVEPINEPWDYIPMDILQEFYWRSYLIVQRKAPQWLTLMHDSFRLTPAIWVYSGFMAGCDHYAVDTHIYQAWAWQNPVEWFQEHSCQDGDHLRLMESLGVPIIVGEWSLATDNCAMWLNGLNDNVPGYPKVVCEMVKCPPPYMGLGVQPNAPPDPTKGPQDPFGTGGKSYVEYGYCPRDKPFPDELSVVRELSYNKLNAFDLDTHGQFFWNFRTEFEPRWDYQQAVYNGWFPVDWNAAEVKQKISNACRKFDLYTSSSVSASLSESPPSSKWLLPSFILVTLAAWVLLAITLRLKKSRQQHWPLLLRGSLSHLDTASSTLTTSMSRQGYQSVSSGEDLDALNAVRGTREDTGIALAVFNNAENRGETEDSNILALRTDKPSKLKFFYFQKV